MTRKRPATPAPASRSRSAEGRQRAPGRPPAHRRSADGDVRERLLDAAIACYVRGGIAATSLREIAREANVNALDTADVYTGGDSERMTGRLIAKDRSRWIVATMSAMRPSRAWPRADISAPSPWSSSPWERAESAS